ncbi:MAG: metallophosphoesterase family protein [Chloroflexi bacterium]|nr:metallophosphoesterase family protein [Chloroflexota bacterium]
MRIAMFSDIHGNLAALEAVLADQAQQKPVDQIAIGGDLVFGGPRPREVMARLRGLGAAIVRGNTDEMVVEASSRAKEGLSDSQARMDDWAWWAKGMILTEDLQYLRQLPFCWSLRPDDGGELLLVHATPQSTSETIRPAAEDEAYSEALARTSAAVIACGHVHHAFHRSFSDRLWLNLGSVGLPFDGDNRAPYTIFELALGKWHFARHRVAYDVEAVVSDMFAQGLPHAHNRARILRSARFH